MKKKKYFTIFIFIIILVGVFILKKEIEKKQILEEESPRIEKYLKYNYKDIESVTFTDSKKVPTGGTYIEGYVNNDKELDFSGWLTPDTFEGSMDTSMKLEKLSKYEENKTPKEIEKEGK